MYMYYRSTVQSFSTLCLGTIGMDHAISKPCYKGIGKWSFFCIFFVKIRGKKLEPQHDRVISKFML